MNMFGAFVVGSFSFFIVYIQSAAHTPFVQYTCAWYMYTSTRWMHKLFSHERSGMALITCIAFSEDEPSLLYDIFCYSLAWKTKPCQQGNNKYRAQMIDAFSHLFPSGWYNPLSLLHIIFLIIFPRPLCPSLPSFWIFLSSTCTGLPQGYWWLIFGNPLY